MNERVIVSMTSYPTRITNETHKMYLNMLRQPVVNVIKDKENV